jgi:glycerol uptake facilitator-like aquaporin
VAKLTTIDWQLLLWLLLLLLLMMMMISLCEEHFDCDSCLSYSYCVFFSIFSSSLCEILGGGQMVNPAVSVSMWALGKTTYTECIVRIAGQMGGGLVSFPFFHEVSNYFQLTPFGGPEFSRDNDVEAFLSEFLATFFLMWVIYTVRGI